MLSADLWAGGDTSDSAIGDQLLRAQVLGSVNCAGTQAPVLARVLVLLTCYLALRFVL